jgi:hypothetical protein
MQDFFHSRAGVYGFADVSESAVECLNAVDVFHGKPPQRFLMQAFSRSQRLREARPVNKKPCFSEGETGFSEVESHGRSSFEKGSMPSPEPPRRYPLTNGAARDKFR